MYKLDPADVNNVFSKTVWDLWAFFGGLYSARWAVWSFKQVPIYFSGFWEAAALLCCEALKTFCGLRNLTWLSMGMRTTTWWLNFFSFLGKLVLFFVRARLSSAWEVPPLSHLQPLEEGLLNCEYFGLGWVHQKNAAWSIPDIICWHRLDDFVVSAERKHTGKS